MQVDYSQVTAILLSSVIRRQYNDSDFLSHLPSPEFLALTSTDYLILVNRLWYASLLLSLATALLSILAKQWLITFRLPSAASSPKQWALWRQFRYSGFDAWNVPLIIAILPFLLHLSLFLFAIGLVLFLKPFEPGAWKIAAAFLATSGALYFLVTFLPLRYPACPYRTRLFELGRQWTTIWPRWAYSCTSKSPRRASCI